MTRDLLVETASFPLAGVFTISRGSRTSAEVLTCTIEDAGKRGRGECVPYRRYGETLDSVAAQIEEVRGAVVAGIGRDELMRAMPAGAARNALDCALWDLEAKLSGRPAHEIAGAAAVQPVITAFTISLADADTMAAQARANAHRPLLKVKVGTGDDVSRIEAVTRAAPGARIILDANEGWSEGNIRNHMLAAARCGVALIEQPLPQGKDAILRAIPHPVPVCADESVHTAENLDALAGLYDAINIKLDKTGGLTGALELRRRARELGFGVMVGCMVGTSLAMAPAVLVAQDADFVDLDGPLLLAEDRSPGLVFEGSLIRPPQPDLWG